MSEIIKPLITEIMPSEMEVLTSQGAKSISDLPSTLVESLKSSLILLRETSQPIAIIKECTLAEFNEIYSGEGKNEIDGILPSIVKNAEKLHLYAATIGNGVTYEITKHFNQNEFPLGSFLDSGASIATDKFSEILERKVKHGVTFSYSPGYCGWHVSGQKKLFQFLEPKKIGITLNQSYLMTPLKSVSGVLVSGPSDIHIFENNFLFCKDCTTYSCKSRMKTIIKA